MGAATIKERLAAIDLENPRVDEAGIEAALREHLGRLGTPPAVLRVVPDVEAGFREVARLKSEGWWNAPPSGPSWRSTGMFGTTFALWDRRGNGWHDRGGFSSDGDFAAADLDQEIVAAARRSASHWRSAHRVVGGIAGIPNPVLASRVALQATSDERDADRARVPSEPPRPGPWNANFTPPQKSAHWARDDKRREWERLPQVVARTRLELAEPLVTAVESGLFAFFLLGRGVGNGHRAYSGVVVPRPRLCIARVPRGTLIRAELHAWEEPAVRWPGGAEYWYWHGHRIWRELFERPSRLTARYVVNQENVERRRVLFERLGYERFLESAGATLVQQDDYGRLWRTEVLLDGEAATVVEVTNATQEPDGTHRRYFLRVPPSVRTARAAVAWSFDLTPREYALAAAS